MKKKFALSIAAIALVICCAVGGTLAWLTDQTASVKNTFTVGNIDITLTESKGVTSSNPQEGTFKMVPGNTIEKDPKVTVVAGSEDCWLFVKVEKSSTLDNYIAYAIDSNWTALADKPGVYYYNGTVPQGTPISVLGEGSYPDTNPTVTWTKDHVAVKPEVTKAMMDNLTSSGATLPTLTFTAYAVQKDNIADVTTAWAKVAPTP